MWPHTEIVMRVMCSVVLLGAGVYVTLSGAYDFYIQQWATGVIAFISGYWLSSRSS